MLIVELNDLNVLKSDADAYLIGVENFSSECYHHFSILEVKEIVLKVKENKKLAFIDLTNVFHDQDLPKVKEFIDEMEYVDGFFYVDLGLTSLIERSKRVYFSPTYLTNQFDIEIACSENKYVLVSPELSLKELENIKFNEQMFLLAFGPWEIFHSRRPLISNYFKYRGSQCDSNAKYHVIEEFRSDLYPIVENNGTKIYLNGYYYLGLELNNRPNNLLIKSFDLSSNLVIRIVELYKKLMEENIDIEEELLKLNISLNKGLLYEESILKKGGNNE